jgi:hypothetical protein
MYQQVSVSPFLQGKMSQNRERDFDQKKREFSPRIRRRGGCALFLKK